MTVPPPPPGFLLDTPPPPDGFVLDGAQPPPAVNPRVAEFANSPEGRGPSQAQPYSFDVSNLTSQPERNAFGIEHNAARRGLQLGLQDTGAGLVELGALPFDLAAGAQNLAATGVNKVFGTNIPMATPASEMAKNAGSHIFEKLTGVPVIPDEDRTFGEKLVGNIDRMGAQAAASIPALARVAAVRGVELAAGSKPKAIDALVRPYAGENIGRTVAGDAAAAGGAGTAQTYAADSGYDGPVSQTLASIAGGAAGMTVPQVAGRIPAVAKALGTPFGGGVDKDVSALVNSSLEDLPVRKAVSDRAASILQGKSVDPNAALAQFKENKADLGRLLPEGPAPTPAALSQDSGLARIEQDARLRNQGPFETRDKKFNSAVRDVLDKVAPKDATADPLIAKAQAEKATRLTAAEGDIQHAQGYAERVQNVRQGHGDSVAPFADRGPAASRRLDTAVVDEGYLPIRTESSRLYTENVSPDAPVDLSGAAAAAARVRQDVEGLPPSFRSRQMNDAMLQDAEDLGPATYDNARKLRMALSQEERASRAAGEFGQVDNLRAIRKPIESEINRVNPEAERNFRENVAPTYRAGPGDEAALFTKDIDRDPTRSTTPPSQTAGRFLQPGQPEKMASLQRMIEKSKTPEAAQAATREFFLSDMARSGVVDPNTGTLKPHALRNWAAKWGADLDSVSPGFSQEVKDLTEKATKGQTLAGKMADEVKAAIDRGKITRDEIDKGALGLVLKNDPDKAVASIMGRGDSKKLLGELVRLTDGDEQARNGLKAAVRDYLIEKATESSRGQFKLVPGDERTPVNFGNFAKIFDEHADALTSIFSPKEMNALRAGHKALALTEGVKSGRVTTGSDTVEKTANIVEQARNSPIGRGVEALARFQYGALYVGGKLGALNRALGHVTGGPDPAEVRRVLETGIMKPELFELLMGRKLPIASPAWNSRLNAVLGAGAGARASNQD